MFAITDFSVSNLLPHRVRDSASDRGRGEWGEGRGLREMEGRVDENNRSLLPNPFVSAVLIHLNIPSPHPHGSPSLNPCFCTVHQALPVHKQPAVLLKPTLVPPDSQGEVQQ